MSDYVYATGITQTAADARYSPLAGSVGGPSRIAVVTVQFDKTNSTLANVTGLTFTVEPGTYKLAALMNVNSQAGGTKYAIGGSATATAVWARSVIFGDPAAPQIQTGKATALGASVGAETFAFGVDTNVTINGTITVSVAGTLTVQFAQQTTDVTASSVLAGSTFELLRIS